MDALEFRVEKYTENYLSVASWKHVKTVPDLEVAIELADDTSSEEGVDCRVINTLNEGTVHYVSADS